MKQAVLILGLLLVVALSACGSSKYQQVANTPEAKAQLARGEKIVKACVTKSKTKKTLVSCLAPPGHKAEMKACAIDAIKHDIFHHVRLTKDLADCVVKFR